MALLAPSAPAQAESASWEAQAGDRVLVDTENSLIYLLHENGEFITLNGLTGQHRNVCYIGRCYFAATPTGAWTVKEVEKKGRSTTFGDGRFLRLYQADGDGGDDGYGKTAYGFHSHAQFAAMLKDKLEKKGYDKEGKGWRSYGCILLSEEDLSLVVASFDANGGSLAIESGPGVTPPALAVNEVPTWLGLTW